MAANVMFAQTAADFTFENSPTGNVLPENSTLWGDNYSCTIQSTIKHEGNNALELVRNADAAKEDFGCFVFAIPVNFTGKTAQFKAFMKTENVDDGSASLFVRIDGSGSNYYFTNSVSNLYGTNDWYEFNTPQFSLGKGAETIYVGVILNGTGSLWADDFQLLVDGKDYLKAPKIKGTDYKADYDTAYSKSSGIDIGISNRVQVDNLALLCKVWGFLKYYHPAIAAGNYNWDNELFRFLPTYLPIADQKQRNDSLLAWVNKLGPVSGKGNKMKIKKNTKLTPELSWITDTTTLGANLSAALVKIRNTKRGATHYYISLQDNVGNPVFEHERSYRTISWNDDGFRMLTVFRYYNVIEYFFPNRHLIGEDWHNIPNEFILKMIAAKDETEAQMVILEMITRINDTHAYPRFGEEFSNAFYGRNYANYKLTFIENKAVVSGYLNESMVKDDDLQIGDIIVDINGETIMQKVERLKKYVPASNEPQRLHQISRYLLRSSNRGITVTYVRDGKTASKSLPCHTPETIFAKTNSGAESATPTWRFITPEIGYIFMGTISGKELTKMMGELRLTKGIVIDLRCYPSDFVVYSLSQYFHIKKTPFVKFSNGSIQNPGMFTIGKPLSVPGMKSAYNGKVVILVNEKTISQAEFTAMALRSTPIATVVGSTTAGADGNISPITLPGGIVTNISGIGVYYPDGTETQRVGIVPDVVVNPTLRGFIEGRDEVLEKAVQIIEGK
ncbi:Peptidase family S41 [anaerobic digester metagenome]